MNDNYFTIEDIKDRTNLSLDFIRRCIKFFKDELAPHTTKGEFNALRFDNNAISIFDKIMQYKNDGLTLPAIKDKLNLPTKQQQNTYQEDNQTLPNATNHMIIQSLLNEVRESRTGLVSVQNQLTKVYETLTDKEKVIEVQKHQLKLLTDGRPPEEVRAEQIQKELSNIEKENRLLNAETSLKEKELELLRLKDEADKIKSEKDKELEKIRKTEDRRKELLIELEALEGKWLKKKQRAKILQELKTLS